MMEGFDTMTMSYYATPFDGATAAEYLNAMPAMPAMDLQEHHSNLDTETYVG
jgi:hypothetical protein